MSTETAPMIVFKDVWKSFYGVPVLKNLSLAIPKSRTTVILGRSGAGKSVTLKLILGVEDIDQGSLIIDGRSLSTMGQREKAAFISQRAGMLFQSSALFDSMTIEENVGFFFDNISPEERFIRFSNTKKSELVEEALESVGLLGFETKFPSELSGGQKRRAALARLIVCRPKILLFDEPTTGLDPVTSMQINELIMATQQRFQTTSIVVTHDLTSAMTIGHFFALHHSGAISLFGNKESFFGSDDPTLHTFIESAMVPIRR